MQSNLKSTMRHLIKSVLGVSLGPFQRLLLKGRLTTFCFHDVTDTPSEFVEKNDIFVTKNTFVQQVEYIKRHFNVISIDQLIEGEIPTCAALITFDDGFKSYFETAVPILERHQLPSINFINMAPIIEPTLWGVGLACYLLEKDSRFLPFLESRSSSLNINRKAPFLSCREEVVSDFLETDLNIDPELVKNYYGPLAEKSDLKAVDGNQLVSFGNHLYNHEVSKLLSDQELSESYLRNQEALSEFTSARQVFAFPFGVPGTSYDDTQIELISKLGAKLVFTARPILEKIENKSVIGRVAFNESENSIEQMIYRTLVGTVLNGLTRSSD